MILNHLQNGFLQKKILDAGYDDGDYCEKFIKYDSLDAPAKMLDLVLYGKEDGMVVEDYSENIQKPRRVIHPSKVTGRSDLEAVSKYAQKNDIVQFEKKWFKKNLSCILHDEYNESFDYVIITNTTPRTYLEEALVKFKYKPVIERLKERELKRTFPRLKVQPVYIRKFNAASEGCSVNNAEKKDYTSGIN